MWISRLCLESRHREGPAKSGWTEEGAKTRDSGPDWGLRRCGPRVLTTEERHKLVSLCHLTPDPSLLPSLVEKVSRSRVPCRMVSRSKTRHRTLDLDPQNWGGKQRRRVLYHRDSLEWQGTTELVDTLGRDLRSFTKNRRTNLGLSMSLTLIECLQPWLRVSSTLCRIQYAGFFTILYRWYIFRNTIGDTPTISTL